MVKWEYKDTILRRASMNKKRFLLFLLTILIIVLVPVLYFFLRQPKLETTLLNAVSREEVNQFYYRAVPGLKLAEEDGLIRDVNKQLELPGQDGTLVIDRIWYNAKQVTIFYHVEGVPEVYLGGEFYLPSDEPVEKKPFHGSKSIGGDTEKGILYNESFYSCLKLPPLQDKSGQVISEIEILTYTPYINIPSQEEGNQIKSIPLKSLDIPMNYQQEEEKTTKIPIDGQIDAGDKYLHFYQIDISPSTVRVYFQYLNSGRDKVFRVRGSYSTDKGETQSFDVFPQAITDYPYHYTLEVPPFHMIPENLQFQIDNIYCIGNDSISFEIDTSQFSHRNRSHETEIGKNRIRGTEIFAHNITLNNDFAEIYIAFEHDNSTDILSSRLYPMLPNWVQDNLSLSKLPNRLSVFDADSQPYNLDKWNYGTDATHGEEICIRLDREFWNEAEYIEIELENLTYLYQINKSALLMLDYEDQSLDE